jgi:flagellar biosynthesis/type III secretory pathway M-ring protein FliF/YscJ
MFGRAKDLFWGLSLPLRLLTLICGVSATLLVGYVQFGSSRPEMAYLLGGQELKPAQLQATCRALDAEGLGSYQVEGLRIKVPRQQFPQYTAALSKREVGAGGFYAPFDKAAEQTSWLSSGVQDDRRWELAKQKSLAQSIEQMPEVETASVLIDRAPSAGLRPVGEVRATVMVKPRPGQEVPPFRIRQIRALVVGAVARLAPENVAVVDLNGRALLELGADEFSSDDLLMRMKAFEEHYAWKIRSVLSYLPDVMVTVNVELEPTRQRRTEQLVHAVSEESAASEPHRAESDSRPMVTANSASELELVEAPSPESPLPAQQTWEEYVALGPKSLTVSVSVPQEIVASIAGTTSGMSADSNNWSEPIRQRVASAVPAGVNATISVTSYPREMERTSRSSPEKMAQESWLWAGSIAACCALLPVIAWIGVRWRQVRMRRDRAGQPVSRRDVRRGTQEQASMNRGHEARRELVRVERDAARDGRGPHIIQARISSFEDLRWLAPGSLQAVLGSVDSRLWAPALRGASRELCERILTHMPARAATLLRDEIEFPGPVRLGDVETAQQEVLEIVRRLDHTGDLVLEDREEILHE